MKNLFFYGTLRHIPLLEIVLGRPAADIALTPHGLADHAALAVAEGPFPCVVEQPGAVTKGLLVEGLSDTDIARLDFYEGSFAYDLRDVTFQGGSAHRSISRRRGCGRQPSLGIWPSGKRTGPRSAALLRAR